VGLGYNGRPFKLKVVDLSDDTNVAASGTNSQTLQPAAGKIYQIVDIAYHAPDPAGSAAGTHEVRLYRSAITVSQDMILRVAGTTGTAIQVGYCQNFAGDSSEDPSNAREQFLLIQGGLIWCSNSIPIVVYYKNDTDVAQAGTRTCKITVLEFDEVI
jgi:hypothetical protein